jgi:hypothetical protein
MYNGGSGNAIVKMSGSTITNLHNDFTPVVGVFSPLASRQRSQVSACRRGFYSIVCTSLKDKQAHIKAQALATTGNLELERRFFVNRWRRQSKGDQPTRSLLAWRRRQKTVLQGVSAMVNKAGVDSK